MWKILFKKLKTIPNNSVVLSIYLYRFYLSPTEGIFRFLPFYPKPSCVFYPTCSAYALFCFEHYSFFTAMKKTIHRISRCHSGTPPQVDMP